jgi:hypothetical protein
MPTGLPARCPICETSPVIVTLASFDVVLSDGRDQRSIQGLLAFRCEQHGHIFFVRKIDTAVFGA